MSATSVGTGTPNDRNENPAPDSRPSKTLGAESGPDANDPAGTAAASEMMETEADLSDALALPTASPLEAVYPDGPNVAPSPGELEAARGKA